MRPEQPPGRAVGQHAQQDVAVGLGQPAEGEDLVGGGVPGQQVPAAAGDIGRQVEAFDDAPDRLGHGLGAKARRSACGVKRAEMGVLRLAEAQRPGQGIDRGDRRADRSSLFEPDVPVDADAREFGHFLPAQARRAAPPAAGRPTDWASAFPSRRRKSPSSLVAGSAMGLDLAVDRDFESQDNTRPG